MESCGTIFVVEDDPEILRMVKDCLENSNFQVRFAQTGQEALESIEADSPDLVILDINLPDIDGLSICRELRKSQNLPILMLSSQSSDIDKIIGLEVGADDYLAKPFNPRELVARIRALQRRIPKSAQQAPASENILHRGRIVINKGAHTVQIDGEAVHLTPTEFSLLHALALRPGIVLSRQMLLDRIWGDDYYGDERIVDVHIRHLRKRLKVSGCNERVHSVRGVGYKWKD